MKKLMVVGILMLFLASSLSAVAYSTPEPKPDQRFRHDVITGMLAIYLGTNGTNVSNFQGTLQWIPYTGYHGHKAYFGCGSFSCDLKGPAPLFIQFHTHQMIVYSENVHVRVAFFIGRNIPGYYILGRAIVIIVTPL